MKVFSTFTNVDLVLELYNSNGILIGTADQNISSNNVETLSLANLPPGTYRAVVYNYYGTSIGSPSYANYRLEINAPQALPDLTLYKPSGWSDGIVISTTSGTNTDAAQITTADSIYIDWSLINQGLGTTGQSFSTRLLLME